MNTNVKIYLKYKIKKIESEIGELNNDDKNNIAYNFFIRFSNYAQKNKVNIEDLFEDFTEMVELDETLTKEEAMIESAKVFAEIME